VEMRRELMLAIVSHGVADVARAVPHRRPSHDHQHDAAEAEQPGLVFGDECLNERQAEGGDGTEHGIAKGGADPGHVARHGADGDGAANTKGGGWSHRHGNQKADDCALDGDPDRIEREARNLHRRSTVFLP